MFGSSTPLPRPPDFMREGRPLRLTSEGAWQPPPGGPCHFLLLHPSVPNQRCACQAYVRNPSAPGTACDCGHQSCYHSVSKDQDSRPGPSALSDHTLLDRVRRLEETLQYERGVREREVRLLHEALAPFYHTDRDITRKLVELEDRIEGNYDEHIRLKNQVVALEDFNMTLEKSVDEVQHARTKRRRLSRKEPDLPESSSDDRRASGNTAQRSMSSVSSQAVSPGSQISPPPPEPEEPRSSGILNLIDMTSNPRSHPVPIRIVPHRSYEARSSGFLALDLAHRLGKNGKSAIGDVPQSITYPPAYSAYQSPPDYSQSDTDTAPPRGTPLEQGSTMEPSSSIFPRKRKHLPEHMALDVLADASMASPLVLN